MRPTDLNELLNDVVCLLEPQVRGKASLEFDPQPLPPISCHTQQVSAVFYYLLTNAVNALDGPGIVLISTCKAGDQVEIRIKDSRVGYRGLAVDRDF